MSKAPFGEECEMVPEIFGPATFGTNEENNDTAIVGVALFVTDRCSGEWMRSKVRDGRNSEIEILSWSPGDETRSHHTKTNCASGDKLGMDEARRG